MSAIKISKDNIIKDTIKINRKDLHTDSAFVFGKRKENEDALYEIQAYNAKLSNNEYLSSEDLKAYDNAINKYESSGNTLRRLSALNGYTYSDEENKSWGDTISSLRQGHKAATDVFSNFKDENEYKTYAKWMTVDVAKELGNYSLAVQYENRLAVLNSEYNKLSNTKTRGKSVYDPITKTTTYREYDNSSRMDEIEREISYCESMIETLTGGRGTADLKLYLDYASTYQASRPESGLVGKYLSFDVAQGNANLLEARTLQSRLTYQLYENEAEAEEYRARIDELTDGMGLAGYEMFLSQATELQENEEFMSLDVSAEREKLDTLIGKRDSITNLDNQLLQENQILSSMLSQYGSLVNPDTGEPWKGLENNEEAINASKLIKDKKNKIRSIEALIYTETNGKARNLEEFEQYIHEHKGYLTNVENTRTFIKLSGVVNNSDFEEYASKGEGMDTSELDVYIKRPFSHHTAAKEKCRKRDNMEAKELKIYYYYIGRGDKEKAEDYLELLEPTLTERAKKSYIEDTDNVGEALMLKAQGALDGASQSLMGIWNFITGNDAYIPPTAAQIAASSEEIDQILGDVDLKWYNFREGEWKDQDIFGRSLGQVTGDLVHTTVYQLPSTLLSFIPGAGPVLSRAYTGISAAGSAYNEMIGLGYRENQARLYGLLVGASEAGLSALLDGTMHGSGKLTGFTKKKILSSINNVYARVAIDTVFNEIGEFTEESLQAVLEPWFKSIATNTDFEAPTLEDTLYSGLLGALSASTLGNIDVTSDSTVAGAIYTTIKGNQVKKIDGGVSRLAKLGRTFSADTVAYQIANKVNDKTGAYTIGRLLNEAKATLTAQNKSEIAKSLERKGFIGEHADAVVNALAAVVEGAKLSPNAIMALDGNPIIARTIRDVIINPNSTVNQRTKGLYDLARGKSATVATDTANTVTGEAKTVETSEGATAQESATQGKYEVSTDGKTMLMSTSEYVNPVRVESIENGSVRVKLDNGETVDASELAFATLDEAILYEMVARMGDVTPETATALIKNFKATDGVSAQTYALDIPLAYQYGKINYKDGLENLDLTIDQRQVAFQHGRNAAEAEAEAEQEAINERINSGKVTNEKSTKRKGSVRFENGVTAKTRVQKRAVALAKHLARALGIDIVFYDDITTTDENGKRANGYFDEETDTIHLDLQNSKNDAKTIVFTMAHELTHFIKKWSPVKFKVFADFLMEHYGNTGVTLEAKMEQLGTTDRKLAYEEMICDACETMLLDSNAVVKLMQLRATDLDLFGKIKLHVLELLNKIRTEYKKLGLEPTSDEAKALLKMEGVLEKLSTMFEEAALDAAQNYQATEGVKTEGIKKQAKKSSMSNSVFTEEEMLNIRKDVVKHFNIKGINGFEQVQKGVLNTLRANGFFENNGERKIVIKENGMEVTINRGSIKETFGSGNKYESIPAAFKILKLATIEQIPSIIESANVIAENEKNIHNNGENKTFTYLSGTATIEGKSVPVRITLKISKEKNKFWVHHVEVTKNADDIFQLGAKNASPTNSKLSSAEESITQPKPIVKKQMKKSSDSYSYESLISKPDMKVTTLSGTVPSNRADVVVQAKKNAADIGRTDKDGSVSVHVDDIDTDVILSKNGLKHSLDRRLDVNAPVVVKAGEIISNSIRINELTPQKAEAEESYVLIGAAKGDGGELYVVRSVVNRFSNELLSMDVLYAISAKKETAVLNAPPSTNNSLRNTVSDKENQLRSMRPRFQHLVTDSSISIAQLLEIVNREFPDVLPESVLRHFGHEFRPEGKLGKSALFQKKRQSNREILADTLTSSIDTSTQEGQNELRKLKEYKEKVSLIEKEEAHLAEIKAEIAKISFNKGTDRSKLSSLNDEKIKTANRIDHYDKLLMRLEAMKPIKNILEREKAAARKKAELKNKEALKAYREKAAEKQRELVVRYQESRAKAVERRRETDYRNKIKDHKGKLESLLLHPTDKKYVPIGLVNAVIEVCELINTDTDLYKKDGSINKSQEERNLTKEKLRKLKDEYEKLGKHKDPTYKEEFDQAIYDYLTKLQENFADKNINDMTLDELRELYETIRNIEETLRDARKLIGWEDSRDVYETGDAIISEQTEIRNKRKKGKRNLGQKLNDKTLNYTLSPMRNVERMTDYNEDSPLFKLFKKLEQGVRKKNRFVQSCFKLFEHLTTGKKNAKLYEDAVYNKFGEKWVDDNGKTFYISKMQAMQVVLSYEREQANNLNHIALGGFTFADLKYLLKGDLKNALDTENEHRVSSSNAVNMVESLRESLKYDKWAQDYMEVARKFFNENAKDAINETTLAIKHRAIATENSYIPLEVDKSFLYREITDLNDVQQAISSYGMLKQIEPGSAEPITITGLNNIIDRHINQVGTIYGLAIEIRNFNKIWNVTKRAADGKPISAVREAIGGTWGNEGAQHIEQAVMDVQGKRTDKRSAIYKKARRNIFFVTFFLNAASTLKQVGSMFSACSMIRPRGKIRMLANLVYTMARHKKIAAEVDKYTATAWMRRQGLSDGELQTLFTEGKKTLVGKANSKLPTALNPAKWQQGMDYAVALSLWKYAKQDTAKKTGLKGEALLEATAQFYDDVVENTQSMVDVLHRPEVQKANNFGSDVLGTFKTDLYQMAGQLYVSAGRFAANKSKENAKALGRTAYAAVSAAVWTQLMTTVFNLLRYRADDYRDDDDGEVKAELILKRMAFLFAADIAGYIFPLLGSEAVGIFENIKYGKSTGVGNNIVLDAVEDCYNALITVASKAGDGVSIDDLTKLVTKSLQLFGVPANNILRTIKAIRLHAIDIANGEFLSFEAGLERTATQHAHRIIEAIASGKTDIAAGLYEEAVEELTLRKANDKEVDEDDEEKLKEIEKDVISSLKTALGNKYKDGEIDRDTASKTLSEVFDMSDIDIYWKLDEWDYVIENGSDDGYSKYNDIIEAVKSGNAESAIEEFVEREVDGRYEKAKVEAENEGKKFDEKKERKEIEKDVKSSVKSSITKYWKAFVINAYLKDDTDKLDMLLDLLYNTGLYGTKKETRRTMKKWAEED